MPSPVVGKAGTAGTAFPSNLRPRILHAFSDAASSASRGLGNIPVKVTHSDVIKS